MLLMLALAIGVYLGLHFSVFILAPFCTLGAGAYIATSLWSGQSVLASASEFVLPFFAVQIGYFLGLTARAPMAILRARFNFGPSKQT
jgi:hypothetical protein